MAIAVASVSAMVKSDYPTASQVLTAPTGITTGDLLVIIAGGQGYSVPTGGSLENYADNSGLATCTGFTEGYFHSQDPNNNSGVGGNARVNVLYRIATVADQTQPTYTVANYTDYGGAAIMFRITGWSSGNPFAHGNAAYVSHIQDGTETLTWSGTVTRPSQQVMLMYICTSGDEDSGFNYSAYASTPSATWTEAGDTTFNITNFDGGSLGVAYATTSATTNLTAFQILKTLDVSDGSETTVMGVISIFTPINASGANALHSADADQFSATGTSDANGTTTLLVADADFSVPIGRGTSPTVWTQTSKPSTTWTQTNKYES